MGMIFSFESFVKAHLFLMTKAERSSESLMELVSSLVKEPLVALKGSIEMSLLSLRGGGRRFRNSCCKSRLDSG
jgi:hypothetical protein